jgi:hypothetical protein
MRTAKKLNLWCLRGAEVDFGLHTSDWNCHRIVIRIYMAFVLYFVLAIAFNL